MKAFVVRKGNDGSFPFDIKLETVPDPKAAEGEVLVNVLASALNHRDNWITQGMYPGIREGGKCLPVLNFFSE